MMEDDLGMMEDDLGAMEEDLEVMGEGLRLMLGLMEDDQGLIEYDLGLMEDDLLKLLITLGSFCTALVLVHSELVCLTSNINVVCQDERF